MFYDDTKLKREFRALLDIRDTSISADLKFTNDRITEIYKEFSNIYEKLNKLIEKNDRDIKDGKYFYEINLPEENFNVQFETKETFIEYFKKEIYKKKAFKANRKAWRAINDYIQNLKSKK